MPTDRPMKPRTRLVDAGRTPHDFSGVVNTPVFHASTVLSPSLQRWREARSAPMPNYPEGIDATVTYGVSGTPTTITASKSRPESSVPNKCSNEGSKRGVVDSGCAIFVSTNIGPKRPKSTIIETMIKPAASIGLSRK